MRDHVRDKSLKTPLIKGFLLKNVRDNRNIIFILRLTTMKEGSGFVPDSIFRKKSKIMAEKFGRMKGNV